MWKKKYFYIFHAFCLIWKAQLNYLQNFPQQACSTMSLETKKNGKSNYFTDTIKTNFVRTIKQHYALLLVEVFSPLTWGTSPFFLSKISLRILFPILKSNWVETLCRKRFHKYIRVTYKLIAKTQGNYTHTHCTHREKERKLFRQQYI